MKGKLLVIRYPWSQQFDYSNHYHTSGNMICFTIVLFVIKFSSLATGTKETLDFLYLQPVAFKLT